MNFFDTTPSGRILNRFSKDLDEIDVRLPFVGEQFLQNVTLIIIVVCLIAVIVPWFLLPLGPVVAFFLLFVRYFRPSQRQVRCCSILDKLALQFTFDFFLAHRLSGWITYRGHLCLVI